MLAATMNNNIHSDVLSLASNLMRLEVVSMPRQKERGLEKTSKQIQIKKISTESGFDLR
jgi:hypothetical protein